VPQVTTRGGAEMCGFLNTAMQFVAGVSGPLLDIFYVRTDMDRRVVVATKAACQACAHLAKLVYFGHALAGGEALPTALLVLAVVCDVIGNSDSKFVLERLNEKQYLRWNQWFVMAIGTLYQVQEMHLIMTLRVPKS